MFVKPLSLFPDPVEATGPITTHTVFDQAIENVSLPQLSNEEQKDSPDKGGFQPFDTESLEPLSLHDALVVTMENSDVVRTLDSDGLANNIAATQYDPLVFERRWRKEAARFDPKVSAGFVGSQINEPPDSFFGPGISQSNVRDEASPTASVSKLWSAGTTATVAYNPPLGYLFLPNDNSGFNPAHTTRLSFEVKQPLLKGFGTKVNKAPIKVAKLQEQQSILDVRQAMLEQVRDLVVAYWDLHASVASLQAIDSILPVLQKTLEVQQIRFENELVTKAEVARVQLQHGKFRQQRVQYAKAVADRQFRIASLMGLPVNKTFNFLPIDPPQRVPVEIDEHHATMIALQNRPDIARNELAVKIRDLGVLISKNENQGDLDLTLRYRTNGLEDKLDSSLDQMFDFAYTDSTVGITYSVPLGRRASQATQESRELEYARAVAILRRRAKNVGFEISQIVRDINQSWSEFTILSMQLERSEEWLRIASTRFSSPPPAGVSGDWLLVALNDYQQALNAYVDVTIESAETLATYNSQLARLAEKKGTLLDDNQLRLIGSEQSSGTDMTSNLDIEEPTTTQPEMKLNSDNELIKVPTKPERTTK